MRKGTGIGSSGRQQALNWALLLAAHDGQTLVVSALLDAGANPRAGDSHALQYAAQFGHTETVKVLLEAGADTHDDLSSVAAWRLAAQNGHKDTVKALFEWAEKHPRAEEKKRHQPLP